MKKLVIITIVAGLYSVSCAGTMIISGLPATVNTSAGPIHLTFDIVSNGQYDIDSLYIWTYTGGTLDIATATNDITCDGIYDDPENHDFLADYVDTTNITQPVIWTTLACHHGPPTVIVGDIVSDLGLTIDQGFEGTFEVKVFSELRSGQVEDVATIEAYTDPLPRTITVNPNGTADFTTIQQAIIDANNGDTIIVADGTYTGADNRNIVFLGKAVTLRSENGPQTCFIDCEGLARGFLIHNGEGPDLVIEGFTITNGYAVEGGGILCEGAGPTILNCIIVENEAYYGGGVWIKDSVGASIKNCVIAQNTSTLTGAGGIDCVNADLTIINCTITDNSTLGEAGGISLVADSNALITNSILWADSPNELYVEAGSAASINYSDIQNVWPGEGNIDADPCFTGPPYGPTIAGLVAHWKFDQYDGGTAYDSAAHNDGEIRGAQWIGGFFNEALRFDGINDYVYVKHHDSLYVTSRFTFSAWIYKKGNGQTILSRDALLNDTDYSYNLYADDDLKITYETNNRSSLSTQADSICLNTWHHVVATFASPQMKIYIDGVERASGDVIEPGGGSRWNVLIGRRGRGDSGSFFNGIIDDLRIYNKALSAKEVMRLYLRGYWLQSNSPCIDAGDPNFVVYPDERDVEGYPRLAENAIDMGAYETHPLLEVSPRYLEFTDPRRGESPVRKILTIRNIGVGTLDWQINYNCAWLTVEPNSGTATAHPNEVLVSVDTSGLGLGPYDCDLVVSDPNARNSPQIVRVILEVSCLPDTPEYANQYAEYAEYIHNGYDPSCWCNDYGGPYGGHQCYGDAAGDVHSMGFIIYSTDLNRMAYSWKAKLRDANLNPCADIDHKAHPRGYRVYSGDLNILASNWKRTSLPGDCPLTDAENDAR